MAVFGLKHPYISVNYRGSQSYGGDQRRAVKSAIQKFGCGVIAGADLVLYLSRTRKISELAPSPLPEETYNSYLDTLQRRRFPLLRPNGLNGIGLCLGLNSTFRAKKMPFRAQWCASGRKIWERISGMLEQDIPVILSIGPNFPLFWKKDRLSLYRQSRDGSYFRCGETKGHYVTVTGMNEEWLEISSWGQKMFIRRTEYDSYRKRHGCIFSNIAAIYQKN